MEHSGHGGYGVGWCRVVLAMWDGESCNEVVRSDVVGGMWSQAVGCGVVWCRVSSKAQWFCAPTTRLNPG